MRSVGRSGRFVREVVQGSIFADWGVAGQRAAARLTIGRESTRGPGFRQDPSPPSGLGVFQAPMRKTLLPHLGQVPFQAGLPFFMVTLTGSFISTFILSRTQ